VEKISVIVPIYNVEKYLERCIESIIGQTYQNLEIILVDDGSPDNCGKICDAYMKKDERIKVIHKENGGLSDARNAGQKIATGEYISFIDSDDYIDKDMYQYMIEEMKRANAEIAICGTKIEFENGKMIIKSNPIDEVLDSREAIIKMNSFSSFNMSVWNKLYKKNIVENIEFPFGKKSEDYYVMFRYFDKANKIILLKEAKYHYIQRENSISRGKNISEDYIEGSEKQQEFIREKYPDIEFVGNTAYAFSYIAVYNRYIKNKKKLNKDKRKKFQKEVKRYIGDIQNNPYISKKKKIQASIFCINLSIYKILFRFMNH